MKVFKFKICTDFYGPAPILYRTIFVVAVDYDEAIKTLLFNRTDVHSIDLESVNDVLMSM